MPSSYSDQFAVRRRRLQMEAEARNAAAQRTTQAVTTALQKGAEIVNQLGTSIGNQQAAEYMQGLQTEIKKGIDDGSLMSAKDGSPLTTDESIANYDNFIKGYREKNAEPSNPWAKAAINKSIDSMRQGNVEKIITTSIANLENQRQLSLTEYVGGSADGQRAGITSAQLQNPAEWVDSNMSAFNIDASALSGNMASMYSIATGNASEKNIPADVAAKVVSAYGKAISLGYTQYEAEQYAVSNMTAFARESVIQNAVIGFQNNVINGNEEEWRYINNVSEFLDGINADNSYGFAGALSSDYRAALKRDITARISEYKTNYANEQIGILEDRVIPVLKDIERNGGYITRDVYNKVLGDLGVKVDERFIGEYADSLETIFTQNATLKEIEDVLPQFEELAADPDMDISQKRARYEELSSGISNEAWDKLRRYEDSTPLQGRYSIATFDQIKTDIRDTFLSIGNTNFLENNSDLSKADENQYNDLIQGHADLIAQMATLAVNDKSVIPPTIYEKTKNEFFNVWLEESVPRYLEDNTRELRIIRKGEEAGTETGYTDVLLEDFEKDWNKYLNLSEYWVSNYGSVKIGQSGETLKSLYEGQMKALEHQQDIMSTGHYIDSPDTPISNQAATNLYNKAVATVIETSPDKLGRLWTDLDAIKSQLRIEDYNKLAKLLDADFVQEFTNRGIDLKGIIKGINPGFASNQTLFNAVVAQIVDEGFWNESVNTGVPATDLTARIESMARDYINHYTSNEFTTAMDEALSGSSRNSFSEEYSDFKSFKKSVLSKDSIQKGRAGFFSDNDSYIDSFITDMNTNDPITLDAMRYKLDESGAKLSDLSEDEQYMTALSQLSGIEYRAGENDDQFWNEFKAMADNMGNTWQDYIVTAANDLCAWADASVRIPEMLGLEAAISYNPDDPRQLVVQTSGGKLVYIQPEFNPDTSGLVDIRMIDPSNPALNESVYSMTPDNIEHTLSGLKNAIDWNSKGDLNDSQFIERKESEIRFMASNDPYISSQMILFNKLHGRMPEIKLQPNALGRFYQKLYNRTYPSGSTYEIVWE